MNLQSSPWGLNSWTILFAMLSLALAVSTLGCDRNTASDEADEKGEQVEQQVEAEEPTEAAEAETAEGAADAPAQRKAEDYDMEAERQARIAVSRDVFGADGPIRCESVCDCPPGHGCQAGSERCVPSMISGRCCSWDSECPAGRTCVKEDGDMGTCGE